MPMAKMMIYAEILRQMREIPNDYEEPKGVEYEMEMEGDDEEDDGAEMEPKSKPKKG